MSQRNSESFGLELHRLPHPGLGFDRNGGSDVRPFRDVKRFSEIHGVV